jgi:hypothetical protein
MKPGQAGNDGRRRTPDAGGQALLERGDQAEAASLRAGISASTVLAAVQPSGRFRIARAFMSLEDSWHSIGFQMFWRLRPRQLGRPKISEEKGDRSEKDPDHLRSFSAVLVRARVRNLLMRDHIDFR